MIKKFFGMNIAVKDLDEAIPKYEALLGVKPEVITDPQFFAYPGMKSATFTFDGLLINLMTSDNDENPIGKFLAKKGEGIVLVSFTSDGIEKDCQELGAKGLSFISPEPFAGGYGKVNFIHPKTMNGVQVEVIQPVGID